MCNVENLMQEFSCWFSWSELFKLDLLIFLSWTLLLLAKHFFKNQSKDRDMCLCVYVCVCFIVIERIHSYFSPSHEVLLEETGSSSFPSF